MNSLDKIYSQSQGAYKSASKPACDEVNRNKSPLVEAQARAREQLPAPIEPKSSFVPHIIDIEASGFGSESYPIEIGIVLANGKRHCWLVKPVDSWSYWSEEAEKLHGLSRSMVESRGRSAITVCQEINELLDGETIYSDAWVHDKPWLMKLFYASKIEPAFSISPIEAIVSECQFECWDETKRDLMKNFKLNRHRATNDAFIIQRTFINSFSKSRS